MANKQALRELQTRLAGRLQLAREEVASAAWLAVRVGTLNCLLPLSHSGEIFNLPSPVKVPYTRAWLLGVVNLRGGLFSVVDLAGFLNSAIPGIRAESDWNQVRLVTLNPELEVNAALMIDALVGLRRSDAFVSAQAPAAEAPAYMGQVLVDSQGALWQELNLQALSQSQTFLNVAA
jgi:twitching motility protein PilI